MIEVVIDERCTGCGTCVDACPSDVLALGPGGKAVIAPRTTARPACCASCTATPTPCLSGQTARRPPAITADQALASGQLGAFRRDSGWGEHAGDLHRPALADGFDLRTGSSCSPSICRRQIQDPRRHVHEPQSAIGRPACRAPAHLGSGRLKINIDQRQTLVDTADPSAWVKAGDGLEPFILKDVEGGDLTLESLTASAARRCWCSSASPAARPATSPCRITRSVLAAGPARSGRDLGGRQSAGSGAPGRDQAAPWSELQGRVRHRTTRSAAGLAFSTQPTRPARPPSAPRAASSATPPAPGPGNYPSPPWW
jgi:ferredoxin